MAGLKRVSRGLEIALEIFSGILLVGLTFVVVYAVFWRYVGGASPRWYDEIAAIMLVWLTYYAGALTALKRGHIAVESVLMAMPYRYRLGVAVVSEIFVIGFFAILAWTGLLVIQVLSGLSLVSLRWVPVSFTQSVIPIGAALFIVAQLLSMPQHLSRVRRGVTKEEEELQHTLLEAEKIEREAEQFLAERDRGAR